MLNRVSIPGMCKMVASSLLLILLVFLHESTVLGHATPSKRPPYRRFGSSHLEQPNTQDWAADMGHSFELYPTSEINEDNVASSNRNENDCGLICYFDKQSTCGKSNNGICPFDGRPCTASRQYFDHVYGRRDASIRGNMWVGTSNDLYGERIRLARERLGANKQYFNYQDYQQNRQLLDHLNLVREVDINSYEKPSFKQRVLKTLSNGVNFVLRLLYRALAPNPNYPFDRRGDGNKHRLR